jgi:hypothetical protein
VNARALLLSLVTGLGHVYLRHYVLGAFLFALFATALNGVFLGYVIESNKELGRTLVDVSVPLAVAIWIAGLAHAYKISYGTDRSRLRDERQRYFREGLLAYVRDELDTAALALQQAVERDVDWEDSDLLFHLGVVELRRAERSFLSGERRTAEHARSRALRAFRYCLRRDEKKKWRAEIALERERAQRPPRPLTRILMAVPRLDSSDETSLDDTAELLLPKSGEEKIPELDDEQPVPETRSAKFDTSTRAVEIPKISSDSTDDGESAPPETGER